VKSPKGNPNKARKGVALVLALMVMAIGGAIIGLTFEFVYRFFWTSTELRGTYVDHTTVLSVIQSKIAQIIASNKADGKTMHVPDLLYDSDEKNEVPPNGSLVLSQLRFGSPWSETTKMNSGAGLQDVVTEVFDMHFKAEWVNYDAFEGNLAEMKDFPPVFNMEDDVAGGLDSVGDEISVGFDKNKVGGGGGLESSKYGAYLIRVRLYDHQNNLIRTAEEAFVQILP
jgi:hypothetical protein